MFEASVIAYFGSILITPLLLWPSKRNLYFLLQIPHFVIAYALGAGFFAQQAAGYYGVSDRTIEQYAVLLCISTLVTTLALTFGFLVKNPATAAVRQLYLRLLPKRERAFGSLGPKLALVVIALFAFSYIGMGFAPLLTPAPMTAKFFAGEYQEAYRPFAVPFRLAMLLSQIAVMLLLIRLLTKFRLLDALLLLAVFAMLVLTLRRGPIASGVLLVLIAYFLFRRKTLFWPAFALYAAVFALGSASVSLLLYYVGFIDRVDATAILRGVPDVQDQLWFFDCWLRTHWDYSYGLSVVGGMVPYHFPYNPSVMSKLVIGADANAASGGFRLPSPVLGFIAYGWPGCVLFSAMHGFLLGAVLRVAKNALTKVATFEDMVICLLILDVVYDLPVFVTNMQLDKLVYLVLVFCIFGLTIRRTRTERSQHV